MYELVLTLSHSSSLLCDSLSQQGEDTGSLWVRNHPASHSATLRGVGPAQPGATPAKTSWF